MSLSESAIFTTVHSGARRTSEPETNLSFSWRKFDTSSVPFHTNKYGETRVRTKFKFVSKTETKSRPGKQANQDSPWKTQRANSCWSQIWDPEARTSSRVWQKKYPGMNWNYWFSASGNWAYCYRVWAIQARSITTSRRNIRTKSGSSWNLYQESARHGRIAEKSRVEGDDIQDLYTEWDQALLLASEIPKEMSCKDCGRFGFVSQQEIDQNRPMPSCQKIQDSGKKTHRSNDQVPQLQRGKTIRRMHQWKAKGGENLVADID